MKVLDLFSGIGGFSLGLTRAGFETIAFCEIEKYPRSVLAKHWPGVPIFDDIRRLYVWMLPDYPDVICGGYPCQPFSTAGKRQGADDNRHLWPEMFRLVRECRPAWVICENVRGHVSMGLDQVLSDLENENYAVQPFLVPACGVNANHRRERVWVVAHNEEQTNRRHNPEPVERQEPQSRKSVSGNDLFPNSVREGSSSQRGKSGEQSGSRNIDKNPISDSDPARLQEREMSKTNSQFTPFMRTDFEYITRNEWTTLPGVRSRNDGLPNRVARLKALGNSIVPQIAELIGLAIMSAMGNRR